MKLLLPRSSRGEGSGTCVGYGGVGGRRRRRRRSCS